MADRLLPFLVAALVIFLAACGANATSTPTQPPPTVTPEPVVFPTPPAGWNVHAQPSFQIALPGSWQEIPLDQASLQKEIETVQTDNPHLADNLRGILDSGQYKSLLFYAADKTAANVISNVAIAETTLPAGSKPEQVASDYASALPQSIKGAKVVGTEAPLAINGLQAGEIDYDLPLVNVAGQVVTLRGVQFVFLLDSGKTYLVTVTGNVADADRFMPLARQIGQSFVGVAP